MIGRNGDEAGVADHIDQNFHPYGHDAPFPADKLREGGICSGAIRWSDPRDRMARASVAFATCLASKTPPTSEDVDGVFGALTSREVAALE